MNAVVQEVCVADPKAAYHCARAFVRRAVNQPSHARLYQSSGAHRTRLDRRVNIDAGEPVVAELTGGFAKSNDFSVGCGIAVGARAITGNGDELAFADDTSADGHFACSLGFAGGGQGVPHPVFVNLCFRGSHTCALRSFKQRTATIGRTPK